MFMCRTGIALVGLGLAFATTTYGRIQSQQYDIGRVPTAEEIAAYDISIAPDGEGLPPGGGTADQGQGIYAVRCAECHGATGREGPNDILVGGQGTLASDQPLRTVGSYWPYATTLWDYINRAMPFETPGTLSADDVYSTVAYILFLNGLVEESQRLDAETLPQVQMPNRDGFVLDDRPDVGPTTVHPVVAPPVSPPRNEQ